MLIYILGPALVIFVVILVSVLISKLFVKKNVENNKYLNVVDNNESLSSYIIRTNKKKFIPFIIFIILDFLLIYFFKYLVYYKDKLATGMVSFLIIDPLIFFGVGALIFVFFKLIVSISRYYNKKK